MIFGILRREPRARPLLTIHSTLDVTQPQFGGLLCILELSSVVTAGAGDIQPTHVVLKVLSVRSVVDHIEWKTIDP